MYVSTLCTCACIDVDLLVQIEHDAGVMEKGQVDGTKLPKLETENAIFRALGLKHIADATRVLSVVRSVGGGGGLPAVVDITAAGQEDQPGTWSVAQFHEHACAGPVADIADLLQQHKFAGDVIGPMDLTLVASMLGVTPDQEGEFIEAMEALQARLPVGEGWFRCSVLDC